MIIIEVDFHPEFQQIALLDTDSGELQEKRLMHREEAAQVTVRSVPEWRSHYFRLLIRRARKTAKVAMARLGWNGTSSAGAKWRSSPSAQGVCPVIISYGHIRSGCGA